MELIANKQIVTRDKDGQRLVISAGNRFKTEDYTNISDAEWHSMMNGTPQVVSKPDDPTNMAAAPMDPVVEGRSPRIDTVVRQEPVEDEEEVEERPSSGRTSRSRRSAATEDEDEI